MSETDIGAGVIAWAWGTAATGSGVTFLWCVHHFVGQPIAGAYAVRARFKALDFEIWNISSYFDDEWERAEAAKNEFRVLAGKLLSLAEGPYAAARWVLRREGFNLETAIPAVISYSNSILAEDGVRAITRYHAERALSLRTTDSPEYIQDLGKVRQ
jgi:hypothetical protein